MRTLTVAVSFLSLCFLALAGCATEKETAKRDEMTQHVGTYNPPPADLLRAKLGVPPFDTKAAGTMKGMDQVAADQCNTLLLKTDRFRMIERTQLEQLLKEQDLGGVVRADEVAKSGNVRGVDYLMIGKVTNFRVKKGESKKGFGIGKVRLPYAGGVGVFDYKNKKSKISVDVGVDLRMVDPSSGEIAAAEFGEYQREDSISAFGVEILGINADADAQLEIDEDNQGKLLRLALDEAIRKMLPKIDRALRERAAEQKSGE